jgi:anhydro-N-acetylmuramic acid kinase
MKYIGLMSGTSVNAIDAVIVEFNKNRIKLIATHSYPIKNKLQRAILNISQTNNKIKLKQIANLHVQFGHLFADTVLELLNKSKLSASEIVAIGSPGQTIFHNPISKYPYSWQLGEANIIEQRTGIKTISDFRNKDIALGGQGAPLVPPFHNFLFSSSDETRIIINFGGISNITVLSSNKFFGYDTGPANTLLDAWSIKHLHKPMDINGNWAKTGKIIPKLLKKLCDDAYFNKLAPKSTGVDYFNLSWLNKNLKNKNYKNKNIQATLLELTIKTVSNEVIKFNPSKVICCGGGVYNNTLMHNLTKHLAKYKCKVYSTTDYGYAPEWIEAMCFAWLARKIG